MNAKEQSSHPNGQALVSPKFFGIDLQWKPLSLPEEDGMEAERSKAKTTREELRSYLLSSLQMQHVAVLAGSGTSLGAPVNGPSMGDLWNYCINSDPKLPKDKRTPTELAAKVFSELGYPSTTENIEVLLSHCEAFLQVKPSSEIQTFLKQAQETILLKCTDFLHSGDKDQLSAHQRFLHRLSRRRTRDSRLKLFTTNYDICFEAAAAHQSLVALDGFSFNQPRYFDPRFFLYDIVRKPAFGEDAATPLEGVFHLYKLHGSVNWYRNQTTGEVLIQERPPADCASLIYPARGKYQRSYVQPHLEMISQFLSTLREPNTCLLVIGFGFNDDHLSEPILGAVRTNPHLRLIIVNPFAEKLTSSPNGYWSTFMNAARSGDDIAFINCFFGEFVDLIPDLKSLTPAQRLTRDLKSLIGGDE